MGNKVPWAKLHYPTLKASQQAAEGGIQDAAGGVHILEWHPQVRVYSHQVLYSFHPQTAIVGSAGVATMLVIFCLFCCCSIKLYSLWGKKMRAMSLQAQQAAVPMLPIIGGGRGGATLPPLRRPRLG